MKEASNNLLTKIPLTPNMSDGRTTYATRSMAKLTDN